VRGAATVTVPVMRPILPPVAMLAPRMRRMTASGWYSNFGPQEQELRDRFADFLDVDVAQVATASSATIALQGALAASPARTWAVPAYTFPATAFAVINAGASLRLCDVTVGDPWLDVERLPGDVDGLLPVAPFGADVDLGRWDPAREVVIDAAASLGAEIPALRSLPRTWAIAFSLHATKCLPAGEGGLVVFGDADRAERFRRWTNFGLAQSRDAQHAGTNGKLAELLAICAHASLDAWEHTRSEWQAARERCADLSARFELDSLITSERGVTPYWIVQFPDPDVRSAVEEVLEATGVASRQWWGGGCHRMPAFVGRAAELHPDGFPVTDHIAARQLGLPTYRQMSGAEYDRLTVALERAEHLWRT
jgi:dTDP-4-amino-4,6-dideoxygalactose transaminase